jgi:hypothetical protein
MERRAGGVAGASAKKTKNKIARDEKSRPHCHSSQEWPN